MANDGRVNKPVVQKKQSETAFVVESLTNKYNSQRQIQINDTYAKEGDLFYGRRGVNIDVIDIPAVMAEVKKLYELETGKKLEI